MKKYWPFVIFGFLYFNSCTLVTEPERYYNNNAYPPELFNYNFENLAPGQHVDGSIRIVFNPPNIDYEYSEVRVFIDNNSYGSFQTLPCTLEINTRNYTEGFHKFSFAVYQKNKPHGLLNLLDPPTSIFENDLYFDRTPPEPVNLAVTNQNNESIKLNWTESNSDLFYAYLIYKSINDWNYLCIDTITDKSVTTYTDNEDLTLIGANYKYKVAVTTDYKFTFQIDSNIDGCKLGDPFIYNFLIFKSGPYLSEAFSKIFYLVDKKLIGFSTIDNSIAGELNLETLINFNETITFAFNNSKSKIYLLNQTTKKLWIVNSSNLSIYNQINLIHAAPEFFVLDDTRIMLHYNTYLEILDINNNTVLNTLVLENDTYVQSGVMNEEGNKLILSWWPQFIGHFFAEMDITNNDFQILRLIPSDFSHMPLQIGLGKLFNNGTKIYDLNTFYYTSLSTTEFFSSFAVYNDKVALLNYASGNLRKINLYDTQDHIVKSWFTICVQQMQVGHNKVFTEFGSENILGYSLKYAE